MTVLDKLYVDLDVRGHAQAINQVNSFKGAVTTTKALLISNAREISGLLGASALGGVARFGGAAAAGFGGAMASVSTVKMAADMERSRAMLKRFVTDDFKAVTDGLDRMSSKTPVLIADLYKIAEGVAQVGVNGKEILPMTETIAKLTSVAPDLDPNSAAKEVAKLLNVFQLKPKDAPGVGSVLAGLSADSAADVGELITLTKYLSGSASSMKMSLEQTIAFAAAVKDSGASSEVAGTAFSQLITRMAESPKELAEAMNMTEKEFKKLRDSDPFKLLTDMIKKGATQPSVDDTMAFADAVGMERARAKGVFLQMAQILELMDKHAAKAAGYYKQGSKELDRQFGEQAGIAYAELTKLGNTLVRIGEVLGGGVLQKLNEAAGGLNLLGQGLLALPGKIPAQPLAPGAMLQAMGLIPPPINQMQIGPQVKMTGEEARKQEEEEAAKVKKRAEQEFRQAKEELENARQINAENEGQVNRIWQELQKDNQRGDAQIRADRILVAAAEALANSRKALAKAEENAKAKDPAVAAAGFAKDKAEKEASKDLVATVVGMRMQRYQMKPMFGDAETMWKRISAGGDRDDIKKVLADNAKKIEIQTQVAKEVAAAVKEQTAVLKDGVLVLAGE